MIIKFLFRLYSIIVSNLDNLIDTRSNCFEYSFLWAVTIQLQALRHWRVRLQGNLPPRPAQPCEYQGSPLCGWLDNWLLKPIQMCYKLTFNFVWAALTLDLDLIL